MSPPNFNFFFDVGSLKNGAGNIFLPQDATKAKRCVEILENFIVKEGLQLLGWRDVPVDDAQIGKNALKAKPNQINIRLSL